MVLQIKSSTFEIWAWHTSVLHADGAWWPSVPFLLCTRLVAGIFRNPNGLKCWDLLVKKVIAYFTMWLFLILGRALILKNAQLCSQIFEIASWSGAKKLPVAFKTVQRHCIWRRRTSFALRRLWVWSRNRSGRVKENLPKLFKMVGGILKSIQGIQTA